MAINSHGMARKGKKGPILKSSDNAVKVLDLNVQLILIYNASLPKESMLGAVSQIKSVHLALAGFLGGLIASALLSLSIRHPRSLNSYH